MKRKLFLKSAVGLFATPLVFNRIKPYWGTNRIIYKSAALGFTEALGIRDDDWMDVRQYAKMGRGVLRTEYPELSEAVDPIESKKYDEFMDSFIDKYYAAWQLPRKL